MDLVRVVVAEDNLLVRTGIEGLLALEDDVRVVASCVSFDELVAAVEADPPDVVLTDICMPPSHTDEGVRAAARWRDTHPELGVVVLSQCADAAYALALMARGSQRRGYLLKERVAVPGQLADALRTVAGGGSVVDATVVDALVAARSRQASSPLGRLTPREREVLAELAGGRSNAAIAARLHVTERSVEKHVNAIFSKLDLAAEPDRHRRVSAVLLHLADVGGAGAP